MEKFMYKLYDKHPCWFGIIIGAISGGVSSLIANIILLLAKRLLM